MNYSPCKAKFPPFYLIKEDWKKFLKNMNGKIQML